MKTIFIHIFIFQLALNFAININIAGSQGKTQYNSPVDIDIDNPLEYEKKFKVYSENSSKDLKEKKELSNLIEINQFRLSEVKIQKDNSVNLLGDVGNNINFGGFYGPYAVLNFTPQLNIRPADFLSVYANHYLNILIPFSKAKEISGTILVNSITMIALDNATDLLFKNENWIAEIAGFALKNCIINFFLKPELDNNSGNSERILQFDNFYYSFSITF